MGFPLTNILAFSFNLVVENVDLVSFLSENFANHTLC